MKTEDNKLSIEYMFNQKFREYADKYCTTCGINLEEALTHELIHQAYLYYREV